MLAKVSVPLSFLAREAASVPGFRPKAAFSVRVLPPTTSIARVFAVVLKTILRLVVILSVARRVAVPVTNGFRKMTLSASPSAPSVATESTPFWMSIIEPLSPKLLLALPSTMVPAPLLMKATLPAPVWPPLSRLLIVRPWTTFEAEAVTTLKVGVAVVDRARPATVISRP